MLNFKIGRAYFLTECSLSFGLVSCIGWHVGEFQIGKQQLLLFPNIKVDWNRKGYIVFDIWHPN